MAEWYTQDQVDDLVWASFESQMDWRRWLSGSHTFLPSGHGFAFLVYRNDLGEKIEHRINTIKFYEDIRPKGLETVHWQTVVDEAEKLMQPFFDELDSRFPNPTSALR